MRRTPVPLMTGAVRAELVTAVQVFPRGQLWDISPIGACLVVRDFIDELLEGALVTVRLICESSHQSLEVQGQARWSHPELRSTFLGIHFAEGSLRQGQFLESYLDPHWAD
ncbi:PilZ domain-containing protein [Vulcanococcus limneticus]|uniref:PilZ domain-containing protein n=1 Tax=Vulcanococcus limneticus TaxID=2170428 RepID=UPI00398BCAF2